MALTKWHGGQTGLEEMPDGTVSAYYTEIFREVPNLYGGEVSPPSYPYGYFPGEAGPSYSTHQTIYGYKRGTLTVTINGTDLDIDLAYQLDGETGLFKIPYNTSGFVRVTYMPYDDDKYYAKTGRDQFLQSYSRYRLTPTKKLHIDEILYAMDQLSVRMGAMKRRFSIEGYTGFPLEHDVSSITVNESEETYTINGVSIVEAYTPLLTQLVQEISNQLIYLAEFALSNHSASIVPGTAATYTVDHFRATTLEDFRRSINTIEAALDAVGI